MHGCRHCRTPALGRHCRAHAPRPGPAWTRRGEFLELRPIPRARRRTRRAPPAAALAAACRRP